MIPYHYIARCIIGMEMENLAGAPCLYFREHLEDENMYRYYRVAQNQLERPAHFDIE